MRVTAAPAVEASAPARRGSARRAPRITYAVSRWGTPTETFVRREATGARSKGADVGVLSLKPPAPDDTGLPVVRMSAVSVLRNAARTLRQAPRPSWTVLREVVLRSRPRTLAPRLVASIVGLAWAQDPAASADLVHADLDLASHRNGVTEVVLHDAAAPAGSLKRLAAPEASYDPVAGTCASVYCHSSGQGAPAYRTTPAGTSSRAVTAYQWTRPMALNDCW